MSLSNPRRTISKSNQSIKYDGLPKKEVRSYEEIKIYKVYTAKELLRERARYLLVAFLPFFVILGLLLAMLLESTEVAIACLMVVSVVYAHYFKRHQREVKKFDQERESAHDEIDEV